MHDDLFGGLCGDAAEIDRRQRIDEEIADRLGRVHAPRDFQGDLTDLVLDLFDHFGEAGQPDLTGLAIDLGADIVVVTVFGTAGFLNGLLHGDQHLVLIDAFLPRDGIGHLQQFRTRHPNGGFHLQTSVL